MRNFNKVFVIALPRCATVSMSDALGQLGIRTAHLGRIYGESMPEHNHPARLKRMYHQIEAGEFTLDILQQCDGLADYPACCFDVMRELDANFPGSLFINVRRDDDQERWLQSVERQFVGLQLLKAGRQASTEDQEFMRVMLSFREMTFGQSTFNAEAYSLAYSQYQARVDEHFSGRATDILTIADINQLETYGYAQICEFLDVAVPELGFPRSNKHSELPSKTFMQALDAGLVESQTGIKTVQC